MANYTAWHQAEMEDVYGVPDEDPITPQGDEEDHLPAWMNQHLPEEDGEFIDGVFHPADGEDVQPEEFGLDPPQRQNAYAADEEGEDQLLGFLPPEDGVVLPQEQGVPWCWRCGDPQNADTAAYCNRCVAVLAGVVEHHD